MTGYYNIIKADYLQRFRSYTFMIVLLVSIMIAYAFVPGENANYTTITIGRYVGYSNAAWVGHVTAIMASCFLWLIGFYIINNGIRRDKETGVGQIIATTSITNFKYLLAKSLSNFLILLTLVGIIFLAALGIIITRGNAYEFNIGQFLFPYFFTTLPSIFFLAVLTVVLEVICGQRTHLLNIIFLFLFIAIGVMTNGTKTLQVSWLDPLGIKFLINEILLFTSTRFGEPNLDISVGFNFGNTGEIKYFLYPGSHFSATYIASRLVWILLAFLLLGLAAKFFKRFDTKSIVFKKSRPNSFTIHRNQSDSGDLKVDALAKTEPAFGIYPLVRAELILLLRKGARWFWIINAGIFISLLIMPLQIALKIGLPIFWFLQINRWADLTTKEIYFGTDKFIYSTYKPIERLLVSQILAGFFLAVSLALPVILKLILHSEIIVACEVALGAILLVSFSVCCGIVWGGKRFFEIVFFMITYLGVQGLPFIDYWGSNHTSMYYIILQVSMATAFLCIAFFARKYIIKHQ